MGTFRRCYLGIFLGVLKKVLILCLVPTRMNMVELCGAQWNFFCGLCCALLSGYRYAAPPGGADAWAGANTRAVYTTACFDVKALKSTFLEMCLAVYCPILSAVWAQAQRQQGPTVVEVDACQLGEGREVRES
eukprot:COSAG06_NODE_14069_length_1186_cov_5.014639_1_plen_132_part_01